MKNFIVGIVLILAVVKTPESDKLCTGAHSLRFPLLERERIFPTGYRVVTRTLTRGRVHIHIFTLFGPTNFFNLKSTLFEKKLVGQNLNNIYEYVSSPVNALDPPLVLL